MKGSHPVITLLGNNSGRNLGDAAILSAIFDSVTKVLPKAEFLVPTLAPDFVRNNYGSQFNAKAVDVRPRTLSLRFLGWPTVRSLMKSDIALICDGIIFGYKLFNPHNFLITLIFIVPLARLFGCKVVCYSCGIGPFPTRISKVFARWVLNHCDLVIMRDNDSKALAEEIGVTKPIHVTGDAAFLNYISTPDKAEEIARAHRLDTSKPILGLNITPYLDSWLSKSERVAGKENFISTMEQSIKTALEKIAESNSGEVPQCVFFSCSPMDEAFTNQLAERLGAPVIDNTRYLSHDIQAVMKLCGLLVGMRFHSLILSSAVGVPVVGLIYAPKVRGYLRLLGCPEYGIELREITPGLLSDKIVQAWNERGPLREKQQRVVEKLTTGARRAAGEISERYFPEQSVLEAAPKAANL